ncbi:ABC transporter ATP-binding protein [Paenibacillus sp. N3.4]|nr:ABC transporter ATP-binding protein [Paenibacillus sp. N3.4]
MEIQIDQLNIAYVNELVIDQLTATIPSGALVSLLGPSGCGKSTTLLALAGLIQPLSGEIRFDGQLMNPIKTEQREIGMVFQNYSLYPHMTVYENIGFPLTMKKWSKSDKKQRIDDLADILQIKHLLDRKPRQLSGGQQQRAAIARALVKQPKLLLLDEPFSNVDAKLRLELREELRQIQQRFGITTLFVTHDQEEALSISDYVMLMSKGRLLQFGTPQQLYDHPQNRGVAEFVGHPPMNLLQVQSEQFIIGIRPEDWLVCEPDEAFLSGLVISMEMTGRDFLLKVRCAEFTFRVIVSRDANIRVGQEVHLRVREDRLHWFDAKTGQRLNEWPSLVEMRFTGVSL